MKILNEVRPKPSELSARAASAPRERKQRRHDFGLRRFDQASADVVLAD
ncbi:hypothetical protein OV079_17860 [Nannocystis pusilla]|uniref:Uncharacterized protein n=1 Tax=Nannocystis pusilla TaxID=889268 RepID=A0A9X3ENK6_9BACT|nr:hypothetical protein [Nannocystis pusilla]MCY1007382.1 hypothetical protein [Nannocystis pusilla]